VGRAGELAAMERALEAARQGRPGAIAIGGEAGVGKTRLLNEVSQRARDAGMAVLRGGCIELSEGSLPYAPIVEAIQGLIGSREGETLTALTGPGAEALARLVPELAAPEDGSLSGIEPDTARLRLFQSLTELVERTAAGHGALVIIEDLHWADPSTRDFLRYLLHRLQSGVVVAMTFRTDELHPDHPLRPFLAALEQGGRVARMELDRLGPEEVAAQMEGILGQRPPAALARQVAERSGGNPLFVEELVAGANEAGGDLDLPATLKDALLVRFEARSPVARDVVRTAAAGGQRLSHALLAAVVGGWEDQLISGLREAVAHHLLVPDARGDSYSFRHALMQEAIAADLLPGERRRLHAAFARTLEDRPELAAGGGSGKAAEIAYHWYEAGEPAAAFVASIAAGRGAAGSYAFAEARRHFERALELWDAARVAGVNPVAVLVGESAAWEVDHVGLLRLAAEAAQYEGALERAIELVRRALDLVDAEADPVAAGMLYERLGRFHLLTGETALALEAAREAVRLVPAEPPSEERARVLAAEGHALGILGRLSESAERCRAAIDVARRVGARAVEGHALNSLGGDLAMRGDVEAGIAHLRESSVIAHEVGTADDLHRAYNNMANALEAAGRMDEAEAVYRDGVEIIDRLRMSEAQGLWIRCCFALLQVRRGHWEEAEDLAGIRDDVAPTSYAVQRADVAALLALRRGDLQASATHLESAARALRTRMTAQRVGSFTALRAELALAEGREDEARTAVEEGLELMAEAENAAELSLLCWMGVRADADAAERARASRQAAGVAAAAARAAPLLDRARKLDEQAEALAGAPVPSLEATRLSAEAEFARLEGRSDAEAWERTADAWNRLGFPFEEAHCLRHAAEAHLAPGGDRNQAASDLRAAHRIAVGLGARLLLRDVEALARRARIDLEPDAAVAPGAAPAEPAAEASDGVGLSEREVEVLRLVAEGMTNTQIARALFISPKTASAHVSHILAKLGVQSRVQAAGVAHRLGIVDAASPQE